MAGTGLQVFTTFLLVSMFYAVAVTLIVPTLPNSTSNQVVMFQGDSVINIATLSTSLQSGVSGQTNVPLLDFGALIFYSSNIVLNLMLNFFTAIPQMITILFQAFFYIAPISGDTQIVVSGLFQAIITIIYFIAIITFIMGARSPMKVA